MFKSLLLLTVAAILSPAILNSILAVKVDDFSRHGLYNNLGYRRKSYRAGKITKDGLPMPKTAILYEDLSSLKKPMILINKAFRITYSHEEYEIWKLRIRDVNQRKRQSGVKFYQRVPPGIRAVIDIPARNFVTANLTQIYQLSIKGCMLLHSIEVVDYSPNSSTSNSHTSKSPQSEFPILLIDDFNKWSNPFTNVLYQERCMSTTALKGPGYVKLIDADDYVLEFFATKSAPFNMKYLSLRLSYSSPAPHVCTIGLVHMTFEGTENVSVCDKEIQGGQDMELTVPTSEFLLPTSQTPISHGFGVMVHGHMAIHRIELIVDDRKSPFFHSQNNFYLTQSIEKYHFFQNALQLLMIPSTCQLQLIRRNALKGAYTQMKEDVRSFRMHLDIYINDYAKSDQKGRTALFFEIIQNQITSCRNQLFERINGGFGLVRIVPKRKITFSKLKLYKFVGQFLGMAILNRVMLSLDFVPMVYDILLDKPLDYLTIHRMDPSLMEDAMSHLVQQNLGSRPRTMSIIYKDHAQRDAEIVDLVPNGRNIFVSDDNRNEFMSALFKCHIDRSIGEQVKALREGFYNVIPRSLITGFIGEELKLIMNGSHLGLKLRY